MIRYKIRELLDEKNFQALLAHKRKGNGEKFKRATMLDVARATGLNRMTLSKIAHTPGYSTVTANIDALCRFFDCRIEQLLEYVPDPSGDSQVEE